MTQFCDFHRDGEYLRCSACGRTVRSKSDTRIFAKCRVFPGGVPPVVPQPRGLGDYVAAGLAAVGITPERVSAALGVKDCGCKKRAEALNRIGRRLGIG
jgi:hypothetical protein